MAKSFDVKKWDSVPLPQVLRDASIGIPEGYGYVSHAVHHFQPKVIKRTAKRARRPGKDITAAAAATAEPETIEETVLKPVTEYREDQGEPYLTSANHAFYIGKFFPKSLREKLFDLLGWTTAGGHPSSREVARAGEHPSRREVARAANSRSPRSEVGTAEDQPPRQDIGTGREDEPADGECKPSEHIYNQQLIEATLAYQFAHLQPGEKAQVVVGPCLSRIVNGKKDMAGALTAAEEIALFERIVAKKFPEFKDRIEVHELDKLPLHSRLFAEINQQFNEKTAEYRVLNVLRKAAEESEKLDVSKADYTLDSFTMAGLLFQAARESEGLEMRFKATVPGKLKKSIHSREGARALTYGVLETAIRLAEILNRRNIHAGAERQALYDDTIVELLKGSHGRFARVKALQRLFPIIEGKIFETIHVDNKVNPPVLHGIRSRARARIAMLGLVGASLIGGGVKIGEWRKDAEMEQRQEEFEQALAQDLANEQFYFDYKWPVPKEANVSNFQSLSEDVRAQIGLRYNISDEQLVQLQPYLDDYLLKQKNSLSSMAQEVPLKIQAADDFVRGKRNVLIVLGIKATQTPYEDLQKYLPLFDKLPGEDFRQVEYTYDGVGNFPVPKKNPNLENIGTLGTGRGYNIDEQYALALYTDENGGQHIVAAKNPHYHTSDDTILDGKSLMYDSETAREAVCHLQKEMKLYQANKFWHYSELFNDARPGHWWTEGIPQDLEVKEEDISRYDRLGHFVTYPDGLDFDLARYTYYEDPTDINEKGKEILLARHSPDQPFSRTVAFEAAWYYKLAQSERWESDNFCDNPAERRWPFDPEFP